MLQTIGNCGARGAHCVCSLPPHHDGPHKCTNLTLWDATPCGGRWTGDYEGDDFEIVALPGSGTE